jgi:hypothetical protein
MNWWVSWQPDAPSGQPPYVIINQAAKPAPFVAGRVDGPYSSEAAAHEAASTATPPPSTAAASNSPKVPSVPGLSTLEQFGEFPLKILGWISDRENIVRVVKVIVGSIMMLVGMDMLVKDTTNIDIGGAVKTAAMTAVM